MSTTIKNQKLFCNNCGEEQVIPYPIEIPLITAMMQAFDSLHKDCKQTWAEPQVDQSEEISQRMLWWLSQGERGASSETMFSVIAGDKMWCRSPMEYTTPSDPSDFRRCSLLLEVIPEWKNELYKLKDISPVWSKLVDNWDKLENMLLENMKLEKDNGMYSFMESLGC